MLSRRRLFTLWRVFSFLAWVVSVSIHGGESFAALQDPADRQTQDSYAAHSNAPVHRTSTTSRRKEGNEMSQTRQVTSREGPENPLGSGSGFVMGNKEGDVTLTLFFDYNCIYCRMSLATIDALLTSDSNLRLVLKEFPILGRRSRDTARLALASVYQGAYPALNRALFSFEGPLDKRTALRIAEEIGLDTAKLEADSQRSEIEAILHETGQYAVENGVTSTPTYVLGKSIMPGMMGVETLKSKIVALRKKRNEEKEVRSSRGG